MKTKTIEIPENLDLNVEKLIELGILTQKQAVKKTLTYDDIQAKLKEEDLENYSNYYIGDDNLYFIHKAFEPNLEALVKLINTAKYLNGDWMPDFNDKTQSKYMLYYDHDKNIFKIISNSYLQCNAVLFKTNELAQQAIEILGEDTIKKALTLNY